MGRNTPAVHKERNIRAFGLDIHNPVFLVAAGIVALFVALSLSAPEAAGRVFHAVRVWTTTQLDWVFMLSANVFLLFCLTIAALPMGRIRIGGKDAKPEYSLASWFAMMFAAGVGIGLMFYGVLEPVTHTMTPPLGLEGASFEERRAVGMASAFFHWGLHAWGIYTVVGLALAVFSFNYGLPLTVRSAFHPLLGERTWGWPGHVIDILAVFATLFGLATSLGLGAQQITAGLSYLFGLPDEIGMQTLVVALITLVAIVSVVLGMDRGVKRLSELNLLLVGLLLCFVLATGPFWQLLAGMLDNALAYVRHLPALSSWSGREPAFFHGWTTFYWAWWVAWSPFVGMFIARVSKGRTVREFVLAALLGPTLVTIVWFGALGGSALIDMAAAGETPVSLAVARNEVELALFKLLETLPLASVTSVVAVALIVIFFVSSMDSGSLVVDSITAGGKTDAPVIQRVFWCTFEGLIAIVLLVGGGLTALQAASLATGFPFVFVLLALCLCLYLGLRRLQREAP